MKYDSDIDRLRRTTILVQALTLLVLLFGLLSLTLFFDPSLAAVPETQQNLYRGNWVWLAVGIGFVNFAVFCITVSIRWYRRLIWILNNVQPETMNFSIKIDRDSESTNYYAVLSSDKVTSEVRQVWQMSLLPPSWDVERLAGQTTAKIYSDPETRKPSIIETEFGLLWGNAGNGAVQLID